MIGRIKGQLIEKKRDSVVIDVHGIGYVVYVTEKTARSLNLDNQSRDISLYSELLVKEDLLQLVGFITQIEKDWFNILRSVQGIGAKVALTILNTLDTKELLHALRMKNELAFSSVSGIGSRMAQRLVVELSGRKDLVVLEDEEIKEIRDDSNDQTVNIIRRKEIQQDALSALQNLGFKTAEAQSTIDKILIEAKSKNCEILIPDDCKIGIKFSGKGKNKKINDVKKNEMILDIGEKTLEKICDKIDLSKTVLWNGPAGYFENENFKKGTISIAKKISDNTKNKSLISIIGGGDTLSAINRSKEKLFFTHLSTAGGAFLEFLEGKDLPGLSVLK